MTPASRPAPALLGLVVAVAAVLRLVGLGHQDLWSDEAYSVALAQRGFGDMVSLFGLEANGILYWLVLWPIVRVSESPEAVRLPALLAGVAAVPALWWAGRRLVDERAALLGAALLAVNPFAIWYAQEARPYSFVLLFGIASFGALALALDQPSERRWWVLYVGAMAAAAYSNALALVLLPAHAVLVWLRAGHPLPGPLIRALGALAIVLLPLAYALVHARGERDTLYFLERPGPRDLVRLGREYIVGYATPRALVAAGVLAATAVLVAGVLLLARGARDAQTRVGLVVVAAWAALPVVVLFALSLVSPAFESHFLIASLGGLCLLLAICLLALPRAATVAGAVVLMAVMALAVGWQASTEVKERWGEAAAFLSERQADEPLLLDSSFTLPALGYAYEPARAPDGDLLVSEWEDRPVPPWLTLLRDPEGYGHDPPGPPAPALLRRLARDGRVFVVFAQTIGGPQGDLADGAAMRWADRNCEVRSRRWSEPGREYHDVFVARVSDCSG